MHVEPEADYDSNPLGRLEIVIPHPGRTPSIGKLYWRAVDILNKPPYRKEVAKLLQPYCREGSVVVDIIELEPMRESRFRVWATEDVFKDNKDFRYSNYLEATLDSTLDDGDIHTFVVKKNLISFPPGRKSTAR